MLIIDTVRAGATRRILAAIAVAIALALPGCSRPAMPPLLGDSTVLIIGDSITAGYGVDPGEAWPAQLETLTGWHVVAAGVSGDRSAGGVERLPALLEANTPALVIIELGGNDMLRRVPEAEIVANLQTMINAARGAGAKVVLMAVPQPSAFGAMTGLAAAPLFRDLARREQVPLIEEALPFVLSDAKLKQDPLHPNAEGHRVLASRANDELARIGLVRRR